jgi:hypothetical protein
VNFQTQENEFDVKKQKNLKCNCFNNLEVRNILNK